MHASAPAGASSGATPSFPCRCVLQVGTSLLLERAAAPGLGGGVRDALGVLGATKLLMGGWAAAAAEALA